MIIIKNWYLLKTEIYKNFNGLIFDINNIVKCLNRKINRKNVSLSLCIKYPKKKHSLNSNCL